MRTTTMIIETIFGNANATWSLVTVVTGLVCCWWWARRTKYSYPPSPAFPWPIVGNTVSKSIPRCQVVLNVHRCVVIFLWSSGIMDCMWFTFANRVHLYAMGRQSFGIFHYDR